MTKLIKDQNKLFSYIDSDFENWNVDEGLETNLPITNVKTVIQNKDFIYKDVFNTNTDCMTQEEVIDFVEKSDKNIFKYAHLFLLKNIDGEFFVARVRVRAGGLYVNVLRFGLDDVWSAGRLHRVVVPQRELVTLKTQTLGNSDTLTLERAIGICIINGYTVAKQLNRS